MVVVAIVVVTVSISGGSGKSIYLISAVCLQIF